MIFGKCFETEIEFHIGGIMVGMPTMFTSTEEEICQINVPPGPSKQLTDEKIF